MELFYIFVGIAMIGLTGYALQLVAIRKTLKADRARSIEECDCAGTLCPPVSVLKPLKGLDDNLFDNLESVCLQDYPHYEVIFSLQDFNDPAYKVARKIKDKHTEKDITILVQRCEDGLNPKVNNLIPAYSIAKYEHILISDSNVLVDRTYLKSITRQMADADTGLVSNVISGAGGRSLGSIFENLHLNSFVMGSVCFLDRFLKMPCVVGKSMLMKKEDLEAMGGLKAFKDVLAEDYIIGKNMKLLGKKVMLSEHVIRNVNEYWGIRRFLNRHTRWGKLRWKIGGVSYLSELLGNPVFISFLPLLVWEPSRITVPFAMFVSSLKILGDMWIGRVIAQEGKRSSAGESEPVNELFPAMNPFWYFLTPVKDVIVGCMWFVPLFSNTVVWRGNRYMIGKDSTLAPCPDSGFWALKYRLADAIKARFA
jgi:ceramide glucosyltransferase